MNERCSSGHGTGMSCGIQPRVIGSSPLGLWTARQNNTYFMEYNSYHSLESCLDIPLSLIKSYKTTLATVSSAKGPQQIWEAADCPTGSPPAGADQNCLVCFLPMSDPADQPPWHWWAHDPKSKCSVTSMDHVR